MGKISNALDKYAQERRNSRIPGLTRADLEVLLTYDRKTCHLLNYRPGDGQVDQQSSQALQNRETIQRLVANKLIYPNGKLTPKGLRQCERLEKAEAKNGRSVHACAEEEKGLSAGGYDSAAASAAPIASPQTRQAPAMETTRPAQVEKEAPHPPADSNAAGLTAGDLSREPAGPAAQTRYEAPLTAKTPPVAAPPKPETAEARPSAAIADRRQTEEKRPETVEQPGAKDEGKFDNKLVSALEPHSYVAEQFKILRTSLLYPIKGEPPRSILITSALPGEGKSFVAANLAVSIALNINKHVLLMDCDMRKPDIHRQFGVGDVPGLNEYLTTNQSELASLLVKTGVDKLTVLPGGEPPHNPSEILSSERMSRLIHEVKHRYPDRLIVIDSPPLNLAAETGFLAREVDGIIVVVRHGRTPRRDIEDLLELVEPEKIIGFVLNTVAAPLKRKYGYKGDGKYVKYGKYGGYYG